MMELGKRYKGLRHVKEGELMIVTSGAYSDYSLISVCRALQAFDLRAALLDYLGEHPEIVEEYRWSDDRFMAYLIMRGLVADEPYISLFLGEYSSFNFAVNRIAGGKETEGE